MRSSQRGFTLVEMLVVIAIITILLRIALFALDQSKQKGLTAKALVETEQAHKALKLLFDDTGRYPAGNPVDGIADLCATDVFGSNEVSLSLAEGQLRENPGGWEGWNGPYMRTPYDPWGNPYILDTDYECSPETSGCNGLESHGTPKVVAVVSCGPDGATVAGGKECAPELKHRRDDIIYFICENAGGGG